jgi:hypothetical protein
MTQRFQQLTATFKLCAKPDGRCGPFAAQRRQQKIRNLRRDCGGLVNNRLP